MLTYPNGTRQLGPYDELPNLLGAANVYCDFETTSRDPAHDSLNPWRRKYCQILGIAITVDDAPGAWYVPLRHWLLPDADVYDGGRIEHMENWQGGYANAIAWLSDILRNAVYWVNQNIKYDAHVLANNGGLDVLSCNLELLCTLTKAKLYNSDMAYRGGYGLDNLSLKWLNHDISPYYEAMQPYLQQRIRLAGTKSRIQNRDYGLVPPDIMAPYAGQDVITARNIDAFLAANMPERSSDVCNTELLLTKILVDMERTGLTVDPIEVQKAWVTTFARLRMLEQYIADQADFEGFRPHVNEDCYELLCNRWGLPVLAYTDGEDVDSLELDPQQRGPSFSKTALAEYSHHIGLDEQQRAIVHMMREYRQMNTRLNIFLSPYVEILRETGESVIHGTYNQCVRTGRMGCSDPNLMNLDGDTKKLIIPAEGCGLISTDASQIEFRVATHYIQDKFCIEKYNTDPDVDFHEWMATLCGMKRQPAKTMNFASVYGVGKKKTAKMLASNQDVMGDILKQIDRDIEAGELLPELRDRAFLSLAALRAEKLIDRYHDALPTLKPTARQVARTCRQRGYVWDWYGRVRQLPREYAHISFNTICQATAADIVKERMTALYWILKQAGFPVQMIAQVHDELVLQAPIDLATDVNLHRDIVRVLESPARPLRVPVRWSIGASTRNWKAASTAKKDGGPSGTLPDVHTTQPVYF